MRDGALSRQLIENKNNQIMQSSKGRNLYGQMKRFIEFDVLRGVLLLMMSVDHSPSLLRRFTDQPLGFFSTAECFVFVSAFLSASQELNEFLGQVMASITRQLGAASSVLRLRNFETNCLR